LIYFFVFIRKNLSLQFFNFSCGQTFILLNPTLDFALFLFYQFKKLTNISDNYKINMVEESASVITPPGKKMKQARLPFAPVNKQSSKFLQKKINQL